jgi:hypothetical protein
MSCKTGTITGKTRELRAHIEGFVGYYKGIL